MVTHTLTMPRLGETMEEGRVANWLVEEGTGFKRGDAIIEIETDKTLVEYPALGDGTLTEKLVKPGENVAVGAPLAHVEIRDAADWPDLEGGGASTEANGATAAVEPAGETAKNVETNEPAGAVALEMPRLGETMEEGRIARWLKQPGETFVRGEPIIEIETDKTVAEYPALQAGKLVEILHREDEMVAVGEAIARVEYEGDNGAAVALPAAAPAEPAPPSDVDGGAGRTATPAPRPQTQGSRRRATPLARRLARQHGLDITAIAGSGRRGRIEKADVLAAAQTERPKTETAAAAQAAPGQEMRGAAGTPSQEARSAAGAIGTPAMSDAQITKLFEEGEYEVVPHDNVRKIIARRLVEAKTTIPHFYLTADTEIDALLALRQQINAAAPRDKDGNAAYKVSVNDLVIKALAMALMRVPDANVTWTEGGMLRHKRADIGVAVAIPGGLITPVVRRADAKRISEISNEMKDLAARARARRLAPEEYQGGSSAVSNLGMYGIKDFAAVINPPHATILAVGAGVETPVVRDHRIEIRTIMAVTLSTDHRAVDGALGAQLMSAFRDYIEKPANMLA